MADANTAVLGHPLAGRQTVLPEISILPLPLARKISLRLPKESIEAAGAAFGVQLPTEPCRSVTMGGRSALWLGPDEWMIVDADPEAPVPELGVPGSVVDISHRNGSVEVSGGLAEATLAAGCALDLSLDAFPVGKCTRTLFAKIDIVLWRTGEQTFRVDCWPSFATYLFTSLTQAAQVARY